MKAQEERLTNMRHTLLKKEKDALFLGLRPKEK
jgi:hypothetical protein